MGYSDIFNPFKTNNTELVKMQERINIEKLELESLEKEKKNLSVELKKEKDENAIEIELLRNQTEKASKTLEETNRVLKIAKNELMKIDILIAEKGEELNGLKSNVEGYSKTLSEKVDKIRELDKAKNIVLDEIKIAEEIRDKIKEKTDIFKSTNADLKKKNQDLIENNQNLDTEILEKNKIIEIKQSNIEINKISIEKLENRIQQLKTEQETEISKLNKVILEKTEAEKELTTKKEELDKFNLEVNEKLEIINIAERKLDSKKRQIEQKIIEAKADKLL